VVRLWGAALLPLAGALVGLGLVRELEGQARALEAWREALALWERELTFRVPDTADLLETLARQGPAGPAQVFAQAARGLGEAPLQDCWQEALSTWETALPEADHQRLLALGGLLGRYGWEDQRQGLEETRDYLAQRAEEVRGQLRDKGRSATALGVSLGALTSILLL